MRILCIHADKFLYEAKEKTKFAEEITEDMKKGSMDDPLVVFASVEKEDEDVILQVAQETSSEIVAMAEKVKAKNIMLYPYAHLSSSLASAEKARLAMSMMEENLKDKGYEVHRSPFGWYKSFEIACKGHPLSELSRQIRVTEEDSEKTREDVVAEISSRFLVLTQNGEEVEFDPEDPSTLSKLDKFPDLKNYILAEEVKGGKSKEPPSIKAMQRLQMIDYEKAADSGHFRLYPKGTLIFNLLKDWAGIIAKDRLNCLQIETPIMYDWSREDIRGQAQSFHERHYSIVTPEKRRFVLRFAGDFGLFRMFSDATLSYRHMPIRVYEFSKSFRFEQRGELSGLKRLRAFHMPDIHSFARDIPEGWEEFGEIYRAYSDFSDGTGVEYTVAFRIEKEFYEKYTQQIVRLLKYSKKPALIEILSGRKHYWAVKMEFNGLDSVGGACQLSTDQLDVEDAERYDIMYTAEDGTNKGCIICHSSIGSIERWMYQVLEHALKMKKPELPLWLAPTQVRVIPISKDFLEDVENLSEKISARVDIDDRDLKLGRKIRDAEREWVNMIVVFGEKEAKSGKLSVRMRSGDTEILTVDKLNELIAEETKGYPFKRLPLSVMLTKRPIFRG